MADGKAFLLQAGDCAESFDAFSADGIRDSLQVILQMAIVLSYSAGVPTVKVGRIAGQFAKPRSADTERIGDLELPSFRGHLVNDIAPTAAARVPNPDRLLQAYHQSASTLNLLRAFVKGGFADLARVHQWNQEFVASSREGQRYERLAEEIDRALRFMRACGIASETQPNLHEVDFFTSHEALILGYEEALTRRTPSPATGTTARPTCSGSASAPASSTAPTSSSSAASATRSAASSAPPPRPTRCWPSARPSTRTASPAGSPSSPAWAPTASRTRLRPLLAAVRDAGHPVVWACDPMHGNTYTSAGGQKTRHLDAVLSEIAGFFAAHRAEGTWPGGVHVELTGDDVTECLGGAEEILDADLDDRYETMCDPRLNGRQSLDLAFRVAELLQR